MFTRLSLAAVFAAVTFLTSGQALQAADQATTATITVEGMHCGMCAKKVAGKLQKVSGVAKTDVNVEQKLVTVTGKDKSAVSPKGLWEAVEAAGYKPTKLVTPQGEYEVKPKT